MDLASTVALHPSLAGNPLNRFTGASVNQGVHLAARETIRRCLSPRCLRPLGADVLTIGEARRHLSRDPRGFPYHALSTIIRVKKPRCSRSHVLLDNLGERVHNSPISIRRDAAMPNQAELLPGTLDMLILKAVSL